MMNLVDEPGTRRLFVNDMRGPIYSVSYDGKAVTLYLDINDADVGRERAVAGTRARLPELRVPSAVRAGGHAGLRQVLHLHRHDESDAGAGLHDHSNPTTTHDTVLLEWTAKTPGAATYDGGAPRELIRLRQPFANHNAGHLAFNPLATPGTPEFGLLYIGVADGGSGGDPMRLAQNLGSAFGKIFRIDPLGNNERQQEVRHSRRQPVRRARPARCPRSTPTASATRSASPGTRGTAPCSSPTSARTSSRRSASSRAGANLGWNDWEGSYRFISRQAVSLEKPRSDPKMTYPIAEWGQIDPLLQTKSAASGLVVYRGTQIPQLANLVIFTDMPSGEIFYVSADTLPNGGQDPIRRILLNSDGTAKTMLQVIQEKNTAQGKKPATRSTCASTVVPTTRCSC